MKKCDKCGRVGGGHYVGCKTLQTERVDLPEAPGTCPECGGTDYGHLPTCSVLAAEIGTTYAEYAQKHFIDTVKSIAQAIREVADEFERDALRTPGNTFESDRSAPRVTAVVRAVHSLHWGMANASIERAIRDASEADHAERTMQS